MTRNAWPALGLVLALPFAAGCAKPPPLYDWGIYEQLLWESYKADHGDVDPAGQLARLEEDVQRIVGTGGRVPPGVHAHLGFLRYATGDLVAAREHFLEERELFPESAVFMEGLVARLEGGGPVPVVPAGIPEPEAPETEGSPPDAPEAGDTGSPPEDVETAPEPSAEASPDAGESAP